MTHNTCFIKSRSGRRKEWEAIQSAFFLENPPHTIPKRSNLFSFSYQCDTSKSFLEREILRNCLNQIGLAACLWRIILIVNWCSEGPAHRGQYPPYISGPDPPSFLFSRCEVSSSVRGNTVWNSRQAYLQAPTLSSCFDFSQWWTLTWNSKLNKPLLSPRLLLGEGFYHSIKGWCQSCVVGPFKCSSSSWVYNVQQVFQPLVSQFPYM